MLLEFKSHWLHYRPVTRRLVCKWNRQEKKKGEWVTFHNHSLAVVGSGAGLEAHISQKAAISEYMLRRNKASAVKMVPLQIKSHKKNVFAILLPFNNGKLCF